MADRNVKVIININSGISAVVYGIYVLGDKTHWGQLTWASPVTEKTTLNYTINAGGARLVFCYYAIPQPGYILDEGQPSSKDNYEKIRIWLLEDGEKESVSPTAHSIVDYSFWYRFLDPVDGIENVYIKAENSASWTVLSDFSNPIQFNANRIQWYASPKSGAQLLLGVPNSPETALVVEGAATRNLIIPVLVAARIKKGTLSSVTFVTYDKKTVDKMRHPSDQKRIEWGQYIDERIDIVTDNIIDAALNKVY